MIPQSTDPKLWYPSATKLPLLGHSSPGTVTQRNLIVIHCTGGSTMDGAYQTFKASVSPNRTSAHFIIDRVGVVFQLLPINETAWHASSCNSRSIGIEHVAVPVKQPANDFQYQASARLLRWLCAQMGIECNASTVVGHCFASPADHHTCPTDAVDVDRLVEIAQNLEL